MMRLREIATALNSDYEDKDAVITGVSTDTRTLAKGNLFVALKGENFDGHDYLSVARDKGAVAALVDHDIENGLAVIKVKNTLLALGELASYWRQTLNVKVVGLTGSNGKTTVKEMLSSILSEVGETTSTAGNFNNDIGLPLTLLKIKPEHEYAVVEMGANHAGEIAYLTNLTRPDVAIVNNAGSAHLEGFGSLQGVAEAKGEIFSGLSTGGVAIINIDDVYADYWMSVSNDHKKIFFGFGAAADVTARDEKKNGCFTLCVNNQEAEVCLKVLGRHNLKNALAAAAAASALGIHVADIKIGLEKFSGVKGRLQVFHAANDSMIIDDSYNANPASMCAAIDVLSGVNAETVLVLGDMAELGQDAEKLHAEVGQYARDKNINVLMTLGALSVNAVKSFGENARAYEDRESLINDVSLYMKRGAAILVKGSRSMHMEDVVAALKNNHNSGAA